MVATLSVVPDTELCGLPMESVYGAEIEGLRQQGRRLAEATSLADQDLGIHEFVRVFKTLIKVGMQYHVRQGGDSWVIAVNPRHRGFYQKVLGFVPLGPRRAYPSVQGHPAEAYVSGVDLLRTHAPEMNREVFGEPLPDSVLRAPRWSPTRVHYFGKRSTQADGRTIDALLSHVERFGSPPRWKDDEIGTGMIRGRGHPARRFTGQRRYSRNRCLDPCSARIAACCRRPIRRMVLYHTRQCSWLPVIASGKWIPFACRGIEWDHGIQSDPAPRMR